MPIGASIGFSFQSVLHELPAIASARHLRDMVDLVSFNARAALGRGWLLISIFYNYMFSDVL